MAVDRNVLLATAVVGLITVLLVAYFALVSKSSKKAAGPPSVILAGPSGAGKTALYQLWTDPEDIKETVISVEPNHSSGFSVLENTGLTDLPGHEKLQQFTNDALLHSNLKAVVYVIDASSGVSGIQAAAERLFSVLEITERKLIPVLIAVNKFDLFNTLSVKKIKSVLEEALTSIRDTKSHTVPTSEEESRWEEERGFIGIDGKPFEFGDLEGENAILEGSVKTRRTSKWDEWLQNVLQQ